MDIIKRNQNCGGIREDPMLALTILDIRKFMASFLTGPMFDSYTLAEAQITTSCTWSIDGRLERAFFGEDPAAAAGDDPESLPPVEYIRWKDIRDHCFNLIRGKRTPLFFKFVFYYPKENIERFLARRHVACEADRVAGLCLNLRFDGTRLLLTTGTSLRVFSMDRTVEESWDAYVLESLKNAGVAVEAP